MIKWRDTGESQLCDTHKTNKTTKGRRLPAHYNNNNNNNASSISMNIDLKLNSEESVHLAILFRIEAVKMATTFLSLLFIILMNTDVVEVAFLGIDHLCD